MVPLSELRHGNYYYMSNNGLVHRFTVPSLIKLKINRKGKVLNFLPVPFSNDAFKAVSHSAKIIFSVFSKQNNVSYALYKGPNDVFYSLYQDGVRIKEIYYLHELQNLIVSLFKVELEVKINMDNPYANFINPN